MQMAALTAWSVLSTDFIVARVVLWLAGGWAHTLFLQAWEMRFEPRLMRLLLGMLALQIPCLLVLRVLGATCQAPSDKLSLRPQFSLTRILLLMAGCAAVIAALPALGVRWPARGLPQYLSGAGLGALTLFFLVAVLSPASHRARLIATAIVALLVGIASAFVVEQTGELVFLSFFCLGWLGFLGAAASSGARLTWSLS
jgi:hypothetical protein